MKPDDLTTEEVIRLAGPYMDDMYPTPGVTGYLMHFVGHVMLEQKLLGMVTRTMSTAEPCPYCGKQPPTLGLPGGTPGRVS